MYIFFSFLKCIQKEASDDFRNNYIKDKSNRFYIRRILEKYTDCVLLEPEDKNLKAKILSNRALINSDLKNWGRVIEDCIEAIKSDPEFVKPYFRQGNALYKLGRYAEAIPLLEKGLSFGPNVESSEILKKSIAEKAKLSVKEREKEERRLLLQTTQFKHLSNKSIVLGKKTNFPIPDIYSKEIKFGDDGFMTTPLVFYYPEFEQFDYITEADEDADLEQIFGAVYADGLPWDTKGYYKFPDDLEAYIQVQNLFFLLNFFLYINLSLNKNEQLNSVQPIIPIYDSKWKKDKGYLYRDWSMQLLDALATNGYIMPVIPEIIVVSKRSPFYLERFLDDISKN